MSIVSRKARRAAWIALAFVLVGLASSAVTAEKCVSATRASIESIETRYRQEAANGSEAWIAKMPLVWYPRDQLRDMLEHVGRPNPFAPALAPGSGPSGWSPWACAVVLSPPLPFLVRVSGGINMNGQYGGMWIDHYLVFFGARLHVYRLSRGAF